MLYILFAGALIPAILSTVDSALLAYGALLSHNIILPISRNLDARRRPLFTRATVVTSGAIALWPSNEGWTNL
jgi:SSS family solute:Na+ symporter